MVEVNSMGGAGGGHTIADSNGTTYPNRQKLIFENSTVVDDSVNNATIVTPEGGSSIAIGDVSGATIACIMGSKTFRLKWTDPTDIEVSGVKIAEWAGTKVVRKLGSAPANVNDGTLIIDSKVRNAYSATYYDDADQTLSYDATYYYRFFPYTTTGKVTNGSSVSSSLDRAKLSIPTPSGSLTYDGTQQTETFTGFNASRMTVTGNAGTNAGSYTATFHLTDDNYEWSIGNNQYSREDQTVAWSIAKAAGSVHLATHTVVLDADHKNVLTRVISRTGDISVSSSDTSVVTTRVRNIPEEYIETSHVNEASGTAVITVSIAASENYLATTDTINVSAEFFVFKIFAVHYSENNSDPDSCDYPQGYDNYGWTPMYVNVSGDGAPVYGSWNPEGANANKVAWLFPKSCMLKYDGTVDYYLDESDETKKADGTASDVANSSYAGNAMMEWAQNGEKIYWKIQPDSDGNGWTFIVANAPKDKDGNDDFDMKPWNMYNCDGAPGEHFYTAKYFGSSDGTRVRSISGGTNYVNETDAQESTKCRANNLGTDILWDKEVYADWMFEAMMCVLFSKSLNSQAKFGSGVCKSTNTAAIGQGTMNGKGLFYGKNDQTSGVKIFGKENPYGNLNRRIRGFINNKGTLKAKMTRTGNDGGTASDFNQDGSGYLTLATQSNNTNTGFINKMNIQKYGLVSIAKDGSESTYYTDITAFNNSQVNTAYVGGIYGYGNNVGIFYTGLNANASTYKHVACGCNISCRQPSYNFPGTNIKAVGFGGGTDAEIAAIIDAYYAGTLTLAQIKSVWQIGDCRAVSLSAMSATGVGESHRAQTVSVQIIDFVHDDLVTPINGKTKALITVQQKDCLMSANAEAGTTYGENDTEKGSMNSSNVNNTGWNTSARRSWCNSVYYNALPSTIKSEVKEVKKSTASTGNTSSPTWYVNHDKCFLLSELEIFGDKKYSAETGIDTAHIDVDANNTPITMPAGGIKYSYFNGDVIQRIKFPKWNSTSKSAYWFERSPSITNGQLFCAVYISGGYADTNAGDGRGIAPAFCL